MSASTSKLDSPEALEAFRVAMRRSGSRNNTRPTEPIQHSEETPSVEPSVKSSQEGSASNDEPMTTASETKLSSKTVTSSEFSKLFLVFTSGSN